MSVAAWVTPESAVIAFVEVTRESMALPPEAKVATPRVEFFRKRSASSLAAIWLSTVWSLLTAARSAKAVGLPEVAAPTRIFARAMDASRASGRAAASASSAVRACAEPPSHVIAAALLSSPVNMAVSAIAAVVDA